MASNDKIASIPPIQRCGEVFVSAHEDLEDANDVSMRCNKKFKFLTPPYLELRPVVLGSIADLVALCRPNHPNHPPSLQRRSHQ